MTAKVVAAVVNLLLYNRNTLYTYNYEYQYECILEQISLEIFHHSFFRNLLIHF